MQLTVLRCTLNPKCENNTPSIGFHAAYRKKEMTGTAHAVFKNSVLMAPKKIIPADTVY